MLGALALVGVACAGGLDELPDGPDETISTAVGEQPTDLGSTVDLCADGDMSACDDLASEAAADSDESLFGLTCGSRAAAEVESCVAWFADNEASVRYSDGLTRIRDEVGRLVSDLLSANMTWDAQRNVLQDEERQTLYGETESAFVSVVESVGEAKEGLEALSPPSNSSGAHTELLVSLSQLEAAAESALVGLRLPRRPDDPTDGEERREAVAALEVAVDRFSQNADEAAALASESISSTDVTLVATDDTLIDATDQAAQIPAEESTEARNPQLLPPSAVQARWTGSDVRVEWSPSPVPAGGVAATEYQVRIENLDDASDVRTISVGTRNLYEHREVEPGTRYLIEVIAIAGADRVPSGQPVNLTVPSLPDPDPPRSVRAALDSDSVRVEWSAPITGVVNRYLVQAVTRNGVVVEVMEAVPGRTYVNFSTLVPGETYYFVVVAEVDGRESPPGESSDFSVPRLSAPSQVEARLDAGGVTVVWQPPPETTEVIVEYEIVGTHEDPSVPVVRRNLGGSPARFEDLEAGSWAFVVTPRTLLGPGTASRSATVEIPQPDGDTLWDQVLEFAVFVGALLTAAAAIRTGWKRLVGRSSDESTEDADATQQS